MFEFKQDLPVQLDAFPVGVFYSHDVSLREHKDKITLKPFNTDLKLTLNYKL